MRTISSPQRSNAMLTYLIVSVLAFAIASFYLGWVFYSRWQANQAIEEKAAEKARAQDARTFELMGGNSFAILSYSADPGTVSAGDRTSLCYSVSNAKTVKIEPNADEEVWPAFTRCVNATPLKSTKYTLTIEDGAGHTKSATVEVKVR